MTRRNWIARTQHASGRFLSILCASAVLLAGCQRAGLQSARVAPPAHPNPVLEPGGTSLSAETRAATLYRRAEDALGAGNAGAAQALSAEVVQLHPAAPVSGLALFLFARASLEVGATAAADEAAGRFADLLAEGDPRAAEARLLQAQAQARRGNEAARLERLLAIRADAPPHLASRAVEAAREAAARVAPDDLARLAAGASQEQAVGPVVLARYAALLSEQGIAAGVPSRTLTLGTVLPTGGSPAFKEFAASVAEGIEVAAAIYEDDFAVRLETRDDRGDPTLAADAVAELSRTEALGAIGFLEAGSLDAASDRRAGVFPLVSPTSRTATGEGVYTLSGADPQAAAAMARYAAQEGFLRVAVLHSRSPESVEEADAFESTVRSLGVTLAGRFAYEAGATSFQEQIASARAALRDAEIRALQLGPDDTLRVEMLEPVALFVPVPTEDVELLAPQLTFFGLDTLAIRLLGTSGWTDAQTLEFVDNRHTTGVVATAPVDGGPGTPGYARFRQAYERHFQRTLVSPVPALGYDAALLLLAGIEAGARSPSQLRAAVERIRDLEGATGSFSVIGGRVVRRTRVVRIEHGTLIPTR